MLYNCQKVAVKDKFFYDALLSRIETQLHKITSSTEIALLGLSLSMNSDFKRDNMGFMLKFYEHTHKNRFMLK